MTMGMLADDDGFVNAPRSIMRQTGATDDDMKVLIAKKFVIPFDSGVIVIKHWRINNYLQKDRVQPTKYIEEMSGLSIEPNGAYKKKECIHDNVYTEEYRLDKSSLEENRLDYIPSSKEEGGEKPKKKRFVPPTVEEVQAYCNEKGYAVDPQVFVDSYAAKGWMIGKTKMTDWKAAVRTWVQREKKPITTERKFVPSEL